MASTSDETQTKRSKQMDRLKELSLKRNEARKLNHTEVVEEDRKKKLPKNWESKQRRLDWEEEEEKRKQECKEKGEDYDRVKLLDMQADISHKLEEQKKRKKNPDQGFSDFEQASFRKYQRLTKAMKPDMEAYEKEKETMGETFYAGTNTLGILEHKDSKAGIDRMVNDLNKQIEKRDKYSRRRAYDDESDIDYINERNAKFNKKLERFYGQYTAEIKQNLERGTAV